MSEVKSIDISGRKLVAMRDVEAALAAGAKVTIASRSEEKLRSAKELLQAPVEARRIDVADGASVSACTRSPAITSVRPTFSLRMLRPAQSAVKATLPPASPGRCASRSSACRPGAECHHWDVFKLGMCLGRQAVTAFQHNDGCTRDNA